jgi:hypothetical protein
MLTLRLPPPRDLLARPAEVMKPGKRKSVPEAVLTGFRFPADASSNDHQLG